MNTEIRANLVLEDGTLFPGFSFGAPGTVLGEVVFTTSMTGYEEVISDPSYKGQIVTLTYPLIGNYGISLQDEESEAPKIEGLVVREYVESYSNFRAKESLASYLVRHGIPAITGVDTRTLVKHIRQKGAMKGGLSSAILDPQEFLKQVKEWPDIGEIDLVKEVATQKIYGQEGPNGHVVIYDFGLKRSIYENLRKRGFKLTVVPPPTSAKKVLSIKPDGILLSNGPGDPERLKNETKEIEKLLGKVPLFGICLGHQLLGLALGGGTFKLKFGHRGSNHPVLEKATGRVRITTQNHGYAVREDSLDKKIEITHINLNDGTIEGLQHTPLKCFSVQFHPEAAPGPHDSLDLFDRFIELVDKERGRYA